MRYWLNPELDPQADEKIANINQLYQTDQERAERGEAIVSTDEMTGVQALQPKHADLPMQAGRVLRREFEYIRHGTLARWQSRTMAKPFRWTHQGKALAA